MKIGIIYSRSPETGSCIRASYISKYLSKQGHDVEFIEPVKRLPFQLDFPISLFVYLIKTLSKNYDVVYSIKPYPNACIPAILKKNQNTKIILDVDDLDFAYRTGPLSHFNRFLQRPFPRFFDRITVHNDNLRNFLIDEWNIPKEKIFPLEQSVDLEIFNEANVDKNLRERLNLGDKRVIVFTGFLDVSADLQAILKALKIVFNEIENCVLIIAGGGPHRSYFEGLVEKMNLKSKVIFTGYIKKEDVPSYISLADVCVAYHENRRANLYRTSMKLREYLAMNKPVVCNDFGEFKSFEKYTYQSKTDIQKFADKIIYVLKNPCDNRALEGQKYIKKHLSWEENIKRFERDVLLPLVDH